MKKWIAILLLVGILCGMLAGCGKKVTAEEAYQIVLDDLDMDISEANPHVHEGNFQDNECYYVYVTVDGENMFYAVHKFTGQILNIAKSDHSH